MRNFLVIWGMLFGPYAALAQSMPAPGTEAVVDTSAFGAFCRMLTAYNVAKAARQAQPCPYAPQGQAPACVAGHQDHLIPVLYGLISDSEVGRRARRGEVKLAGCLVSDACRSHFYCTLHQKYL